MAYIYKKIIGDKEYYYLRVSKRQGKRIIAKDIAYLGSTLAEVRKALSQLPEKQIRAAYKTIKHFLETNTWLEEAKKNKPKQTPYLEKVLLEQIEACRLHWQKVFLKKDFRTQSECFKRFVVEFAFNTTSIEGNTIKLHEAERLLNEQLTPKNKTLHEIYDVQNTERVFLNIKEKKLGISEENMIMVHQELMKNVDSRIGYRNEDVHVLHARFKATPTPYIRTDMILLLKWYQENKTKVHPLALAGMVHHKFEKIHPFFDGNGRTGRMIINAILLKEGYPPLIVRKRNRTEYLEALSKADKADLTASKPEQYQKLIEFLAVEMIESYWNNFL